MAQPSGFAPNGTADNPNPDGLVRVTLFPNSGLGYGYALTDRGLGDSLPEGYHRTINAKVREGRILSPSFGVYAKKAITHGLANAAPFTLATWSKTGPYRPAAVLLSDELAYSYDSEALNGETEAIAAGSVFGGTTFHDDGAGTAYLYAGTIQGADSPWSQWTTAGYLNRRTRAGTWTADADVAAVYVVAAAGALWRVSSNYQISKCPTASEPFTIGNWGSAIVVGTSDAWIRQISAIGAAPIVFKEDGIWAYDETNARFELQYPIYRSDKHFPFVREDGQGGLYTALANGTIIHIARFGSITSIFPLSGKFPGRDTPRGPIMDMAIDGETLYALMDGRYRFSQPSGLKVLKTVDNFSTFTDYSTETKDQDYSTTADVSLLDTLANGDALLIGFDDRFLAMEIFVRLSNSLTASLSVAMSTGAGTWSSALTVYDGTSLISSGNTITIGNGGASVVSLAMQSLSTWAKATYNSSSKYWLRLTVSGALDAATNLSEIRILPQRAAPAFTTTNNDTAETWEASGMFPKVLVGKRLGDAIIWDDVLTIPDVTRASRIAYTPHSTPSSPHGALLVATQESLWVYPMPEGGEPSAADTPLLARDATNDMAAVYYPSAVDLGAGLYELRYLHCVGAEMTMETDGWAAAFRWDETHAWHTFDTLYQPNAVFAARPGSNAGSVLHTAFMLLDGASTDPVGPYGRRIEAWLKPLDRHPSATTQPARTQPEVS